MAKDEHADAIAGLVRHSVSLSDALELAKSAQITGSGFREVAREIAGPFYKQISAIFRGHYLLIYILTDHPRRAAWHAFLAELNDDPIDLRSDVVRQDELIHRFLHDRSEELITAAFGSCPNGYLAVLQRFSTHAERDVTVFRQLHSLLSDQPHLGPQLCNHGRVSSRLVQLLTSLPAPLKHVRVAELFDGDPQAYRRWMEVYRVLSGEDDLSPAHTANLLGGERPGTLIQRIYHAILLAAPVLPNTDRIKHVHNGEAMVAAAARYQNCLKNWIGEAHRGEQQFYEAVLADGEKAILCLKNDAPSGWLLDDLKLAGNLEPADVLQEELREYLAKFGVRFGPSLESMLRRFGRSSLMETEADAFRLDAHWFDMVDD
jgi:hypothetical protein